MYCGIFDLYIYIYIRHRASSTKWSVSKAFKGPLDLWTSGFEIPKGLLRARTQPGRRTSVTFFDNFFDDFSVSYFFGF